MANLMCAKCNQPITEENAVECPHCWEIYHQGCWEEIPNCLTCKKFNPIYEMVQAQKEYEAQNQQHEEQELKDTENIVDDENIAEDDSKETPISPVANIVLLASIVILISGVAGGIALAIYMYLAGKIVVGIIGGFSIGGLGFALSLVVKGVAELVNNSQKNAYYLSKLVRMVEDEE